MFSRNENLVAHSCNSDLKFQCNKCNKAFSLKKYLIRHEKICSIHTVICKKCKEGFSNKSDLNFHTCKTEEHTCPLCQKVFTKESYLKRHLKTHSKTANNNNNYICDVCGSMFKFPQNLKTHKLIHSEPKFSCDICSLKFHRQDVFENHKNVHDTKSNMVSMNIALLLCKTIDQKRRPRIARLILPSNCRLHRE